MISIPKVINSEFVAMEDFGFVQPFFQGIWWGGHEKDHGEDLSV